MSIELDKGDKAPNFKLPGDNYDDVILSDYKGKNVVLYFYPKDDTPGCTQQAMEFTDLHDEFTKLNSVIIGISKDDIETHEHFKHMHSLTITLVSDLDMTTIFDYGVWMEKNLYGKKYMGIQRSTFLINKDGLIHKVWKKVKIKGHANEVLEEIKNME